mgnify:CR=1 FL=1
MFFISPYLLYWSFLWVFGFSFFFCLLFLSYLLRLDLRTEDDDGLLCQFLFLWLMNQLLICFNCNPVSWTSLAFSSSWSEYTLKSIPWFLLLKFISSEIINTQLCIGYDHDFVSAIDIPSRSSSSFLYVHKLWH